MSSVGSQKSVVIVDDSEDVREFLELFFESDGWHVVACYDAVGAFDAIRKQHPDLLVTDVMLGVSNGLDLITRMRSDIRPPLPPIIVVSGFDQFEAEAMARGADAFIPKPFDFDTMRATAAAVLSRRKPVAAMREEAARRSQALRAERLEAARQALLRLEPRTADLRQRAKWTTSFVREYIGFGEMVFAYLHEQRLRVLQASDERHWSRYAPFDVPMCQDVLESNSALIVPDLAALSPEAVRPDGAPIRSFAGVPVRAGRIAVGVICLIDEHVRQIEAEDLSLIDFVGRRSSALLSEAEPQIAPFWSPDGLITRTGLQLLLQGELSRANREELVLSMLVFGAARPRFTPAGRSGLAELGGGRFVYFVSSFNEPKAKERGLEQVQRVIAENPPHAGVLVTLEGHVVRALDDFLHAAETLLEQRLSVGSTGIEQIALHSVPFQPNPPPA
jgi:CheY-like chemotaxis protein